MKHISLLTIILVSLYSCNSSDSGSGDATTKNVDFNPTNQINVEEVKNAEKIQIKEDLNTGTYSLSTAELDELKAEGVITDEDYKELIELASK